MRIRNVLPHVASLAMLTLVYGLGTAVDGAAADQPATYAPSTSDAPYRVARFYEDGAGVLTDGTTFCAVNWPCDDR